MKKNLFAALLLLAWLPAHALAAEELSGTVVAGYEISIPASVGGMVEETCCRPGQWVKEGDPLAQVQLIRVFSPVEGTVATVDQEAGDDASQTVITIDPVRKYTITCSTDELYGVKDPQRYYIHLGETVHIRCVKDRSHVAVGVVTAVDGSSYTVQTTGGELYLEEEVNIYRTPYTIGSWIGTGNVARTEAASIAGSGTLLETCVVPGQWVDRGQLLFVCAEGAAEDYLPKDGILRANAEGVLGSISLSAGVPVQKGMPVATLYPADGFRIAVTVPEDLLSSIREGDSLSFYLEWDEENPRRYQGVVESISYQAQQAPNGSTTYTAYLLFEADETVRLGMSAIVEVE